MEDNKQVQVCVTGGTGYVASWLVLRLLQNGYFVNTTIRRDPDRKRDISYLTNLPGASERLQIFNADLDEPDSFAPAIKGCIGVFHVAHPMEWDEKETEDTKTKRVIGGLLGILQASLESRTVERFVYTSSICAVLFNGKDLGIKDENSWTDIDFVRGLQMYGDSYVITKTLADRTALEFGEKHGLNVEHYRFLISTSFVHVDDVARAHIHLFEHPNAKGRYICSAVEVTIDELSEFLSARYPEFQIPTADSLNGITPVKISGVSTKKLLETGFEYQHGLEEMFDGAIQSCKEKGLL